MKALDASLQSLKRQVDAAPWLRWAALAIAVLVAALALQALDNLRVERQKAAIEAEQDLLARRTSGACAAGATVGGVVRGGGRGLA